MARIVIGGAQSRSPLQRTEPSRWAELGERDKSSRNLYDLDGNPLTYEQVLSHADPSMRDEVTPEKFEARYWATQRATDQIRRAFAATNFSAVVMIGDDENEIYTDDATRPRLAVYRGKSLVWGPEMTEYPIAVEFTDHVIAHLRNVGYTPEVLDAIPEEKRVPHGFGQMWTDLLPDIKPLVPIMVNVHSPVNQTTPRESYELGRQVRRATETWTGDREVAIATNGGLSIGVLREDLDRQYLEAMRNRDLDTLTSLPSKWIRGSQGEIYNWIGAAGALESLSMRIVDYIPGYRSPAGTGAGLGFALWS
jgi:Catalytic LigB subunit of aromatic ring-opening dioxygenase